MHKEENEMKRRVCLSVLLVLVLGTYSAALAQAPVKPAPQRDKAEMVGFPPRNQVETLSGSRVVFDPSAGGDTCYNPGNIQTFCFKSESLTADYEYVYDQWQRFPAGWVVDNVYVAGTPFCALGGTWGSFAPVFRAPNEVDVHHPRYQAGADDCIAYYCFHVAVGTGDLDANTSWYWAGDDYGSPPHHPCSPDGYTPAGQHPCDQMINPYASIPPCTVPPGVYLQPPDQGRTTCTGEGLTYRVSLFNNTGADGVFDISVSALWPAACPAQVYAANGETVSFECTVTVPCGGVSDTATITASGQGYQGSATLTANGSSGGWVSEPDSPEPTMDNIAISWNGKLYVVDGWTSFGGVQIFDGVSWTQGASSGNVSVAQDGCLGLDAAGNPVIDLFGFFLAFNAVERYDINADAWSSLMYPPGFPTTGLFAPDIVSMLQHTGENVCYISGGATINAGGNQRTLYAYHPDTNTVDNLGQYTYSSVGFSMHFSWWVPWVGTSGAICVGGGVDANNAVYSATQCYDLATHVFHPPNSDLGPLPEPWWGGGDAWAIQGGEYRIWGFDGASGGFGLLKKSFVNSGGGFGYGPVPAYAAFRTEGDNFMDSVWAANGSSLVGFTPSRFQQRLLQCEPCIDQFLHINKSKINAAPAARPGYWKVVFAARIHDQDHAPAGGATVLGTWTYPDGSTHDKSYVTDALGRCKFPIKEPQTGTYTFCITDIQKTGYAYDPAANEMPACLSKTVP